MTASPTQNSPSPSSNAPSLITLVMSDVDESFIIGHACPNDAADVAYNTVGLAETIAVIEQARRQQPVEIWWNTVRVLETIQALVQHPQLTPVLEKLHLDGLIVNNGKQMYANTGNKNCAAWVSGLNENQDQSPNWRHYIEETLHWDQALLDKTFRSVLSEEGFEKSGEITPEAPLDTPFILPRGDLRPVYEIWINPQKPGYVLYYSPKHNTVRLAVWNKRQHWREDTVFAMALKQALESALSKEKVDFEPAIVQEKPSHNGRFSLNIVRFNPRGVNKGKTTQAVVDQHAKTIKQLIVVGDDRPDATLLNGNYTQGKHTLAKTAIICHLPGRSEEASPLWDLQQKANYPYLTAESGNIGPALREIFQ
ncbi:MAG: hypothetical protein VKJ04_08330 [Vampirovibrionales bacterium]|nr:hypothetical protein [Vampirovibrionales bacterium]